MRGKVVIKSARCKGCGLCVPVCPRQSLKIAAKPNQKGYFPAEFIGPNCTGCALCARICPDLAIEVHRNSDQVISHDPETAPRRVKEKT